MVRVVAHGSSACARLGATKRNRDERTALHQNNGIFRRFVFQAIEKFGTIVTMHGKRNFVGLQTEDTKAKVRLLKIFSIFHNKRNLHHHRHCKNSFFEVVLK